MLLTKVRGASIVYISMYLFDASYRHVGVDLMVHHGVSIGVALFLQYLRKHSAEDGTLMLLFLPFFIPGITIGDTLIDTSSIIYAVGSRVQPPALIEDYSVPDELEIRRRPSAESSYILMLQTCAWGHLAVRLTQWYSILSYTFKNWVQISAVLGSLVWGLPLVMAGWAKMEFSDAYLLFLFPPKLAKRYRDAAAIRNAMGTRAKNDES